MGMVRRIGEVLGFKAERTVLFIIHAADPRKFSIEKIAGVKLHARFGREHFHPATGSRLFNPRDRLQTRTSAFQNEVLVIAARIGGELIETRAYRGRLLEITRRARHRRKFSSGNQLIVDRCISVRRDADDMLQNISRAREVEVRVIR